MIPVHEAQRRLIAAGYAVDMQPIYRELTIINAKYEDVRKFLDEQGFEGRIVVIGEKKHTENREKPSETRKTDVCIDVSTDTRKRLTGQNAASQAVLAEEQSGQLAFDFG